jgi:hypothetical protein
LFTGVYKELDTANFDILMDLRGISEIYAIDVSFEFCIGQFQECVFTGI